MRDEEGQVEMRKYSRSSGANVGKLPLEILFQLLETLECDFEFVRRVEWCWVVADCNIEQ